jgi:hypothetical protein
MMWVGLAINVFMLVVAGWIVWTFSREYKEAKGTMWERALEASWDSATILWSKIVIIATVFVNGVAYLASAMDSGTVEQIKFYLPAEYVAGFMVLVMLITIIARIRSLGDD